jgi:hypothetical protein
MIKPSIHSAYVGVLNEVINDRCQKATLIIESGILGGDLLPRAFLEPTLKRIQQTFDNIAAKNDDEVTVKAVGSSRFGVETKAVFGDIDVIMRMEKPETLSQIKLWAGENAINVRDIASRAHGKDLDIAKLGDQFSFLFPIYKADGETLTIGELRAILQARHGHTNWRDHHDERLKVQSNLDNIGNKSGTAMVQVDVMHVIVDGADAADLLRRASKLKDRISSLKLDNEQELHDWLEKTVGGQKAEEFEKHYEFLRNHGEMQNNDDQQMLAAVYHLNDRDAGKKRLGDRFENLDYRYGFHPDALQMIYYIAKMVGIVLDHENFNRKTLEQIIERAKQAGVVSDKMTVDLLRDPKEAFGALKGKNKDEARRAILSNTKNKRADEHNPGALWKNLGTREVKKG